MKPPGQNGWNDLRLVADDLTGALDSAAAFAPVFGPVRVFWDAAKAPRGPAAFDTRTREAPPDAAARRLAGLRPFLAPAAGRLSLLKIDSLLRGHAGRELLAVRGDFARIVVAPAFPFQGRATRQGRQSMRAGAGWQVIGEDIAATLRGAGAEVTLCTAGDAAPAGLSLWNVETDADLDVVVAAGLAGGDRILWVGSAGLAAALARRMTGCMTAQPEPGRLPSLPLLGLIGTDNPAMQGQLAPLAAYRAVIGEDAGEAVAHARALLGTHAAAFLTCALPPGLDRAAAQDTIAARFGAVCAGIARPGALFVSGGETLSALCHALGASGLDVYGQFEPGVPLSRLCGGAWDGLDVISKSGAFGTPDFLCRLVDGLS